LGVVGAFFLAFGIATLPGRFGPGTEGFWSELRLDLALWLASFGILGMLAVWLSGRWLLVEPPVVRGALLVPGAGIAIAVAEELALHEWAETSLGYYDWDLVGPTAGLSFLLVLVSIGVFTERVAPAAAAGLVAIGVIVGAALVAMIVASNIPGLGDGIGSESWPAVIAIALAGFYAVVAVVALRGRSRPRATK
jgi:hypothetical protein